ncbi:MAG: hypothetical protein M3373_03055 [Gemmatimonadota bacterium]|nr:hypothetical protein [Gemmatimonadota bacterium]
MTRRGKILRDTTNGPGLLVVDGTQVPFTLERAWKSDTAPRTGMVVDVEVDQDAIVAVTAVPEGQLAKEQAEVALAAAKEKGSALALAMIARFGVPTLASAAALCIGWFFLSAASLDSPLGTLNFTFWDVLSLVNAGGAAGIMQRMPGSGGSTGLYGFVAAMAIAGPFAHALLKDRRAHLANLLPLLLMLFVALKIFGAGPSAEDSAAAGIFGQNGQDVVNAIAREARAEMWKAISIGMGTYLSAGAAVYLAMVGARRFLAASRSA